METLALLFLALACLVSFLVGILVGKLRSDAQFRVELENNRALLARAGIKTPEERKAFTENASQAEAHHSWTGEPTPKEVAAPPGQALRWDDRRQRD